MAAYEVLLLNTAIPQIQAAQSGDTYVVPRDIAINATAIISANSATDALRITQTGAGNALVVEDSANPDSTPFVVTAAGSVGIGTDSPAVKLHVSDATNPSIRVTDTTNPTSVDIQAVDGVGYVGTPTNHPLAFFTNGLERARVEAAGNFLLRQSSNAANTSVSFNTTVQNALTLDSSGNLGLGVTPSAWAVYKSFDSGSCSFNTAGVQGELTSNGFFNASSQWIYKATGFANRYVQNLSANGVHAWFNAPSGTANTAITFTQAMTLDASGDLAIGTTTGSIFATGGVNVSVSNPSGIATIAIAGSTGNSGYLELGQGSVRGALIEGTTNTMIFYTNATGSGTSVTERARITSGGYFKASDNGTYLNSAATYHELRNTSAQWALVASNTNAAPLGYYIEYSGAAPNGTGNQFFFATDTGGVRSEIRSNGGIANYQANDVNLSDRREKTNFAPAKSYLNTICAIPVQTFNYIDQSEDDPGLTLGVVAQDVQAVAPELVSESNWGTEDSPKMRLSIYQTDLQYALMKCIQEQQAMINELKAEVAALKGA